MKKSIRKSLFLFITITMITFVLVGMLLNIFFLEKFYYIKNKSIFMSVVNEIVISFKNNDDIETLLHELDRSNGMSIIITDQNNNILMTSYGIKKNDNNRLSKDLVTQVEILNNMATDNLYKITKNKDEQSKVVYIKKFNNKVIIASKPLKGIQESVSISNQFYMIGGLLALFIGILLMYILSKTITKPIVELSEIANDISNLNFDRKSNINRNDELGLLSISINEVSEKLKTSINLLKDDIEYQRTLSRNISHELKTPIAVIKGYAEGLTYNVADNPSMRDKYLNTIIDECDRMNNLVIEMLDYSKLSSNDYNLDNVSYFTSHDLIKRIKDRYLPLLVNNNYTLIENIDSFSIHGNFELISRAVDNLFSNAIKYNNDEKRIEINIYKARDTTNISIFNTCESINEHEINKLFDVFYKIDKARTRNIGGNGIGLSIAKSIAKLHNGDILVENMNSGIKFIMIISDDI